MGLHLGLHVPVMLAKEPYRNYSYIMLV